MAQDNELFTPQTVDEQIEQLARMSRALPPGRGQPAERQLIQHLQHLYETDKADERSIETVWERLARQNSAARPPHRSHPGPPSGHALPQESQRFPQTPLPAPRARRGWSYRVAALVAAVLLVVVIGGLVAGLVLVRQHGPVATNQPTTLPGQTPTTLPGQTPTAPPTATPVPLSQQSVYVASDNGVVTALNASTGTVRWRYQSMGKLHSNFNSFGEGIKPGMALSDGVLYIGSSAGVEAVDTRNGSLLWQDKMDGGQGAIIVSSGVVYVDATTSVSALSANDGKVLWTHTATSSAIYSLASVYEGVVYVGGDGNPTYAFDASNGKLLWQNMDSGFLWGEAQGAAYFTTEGGGTECCLRAINARDGSQRWTFDQKHEAVPYGFVGNIVYTSSTDQLFYALNATNGSIVWQSKDVHPIFTLWAKLFATFFYTSTNQGAIVALNPHDGSQQWMSSTFGDNASVSPGAESQGILYVSYAEANQAGGGGIAALDVSDGAIKWKTHINTTYLPGVEGVTNGAVYLGTSDVGPGSVNTISAFDTNDGSPLWQYSQAGLLPGALID